MAIATFNLPSYSPTNIQGGSLTGADTGAAVQPNLFDASLSGTAAPSSGQVLGATAPPPPTYYGGAQTAGGGADTAYLDTQANSLRGLLGRTNTGLDQGLQNLNSTYDQHVNQQNLNRTRALEDYNTQDQLNTQHQQNAFGQVDSNSRNLNNSLRRTLGLAGAADSSAAQELFPSLVAQNASGQRNDVLQTDANNQAQIGTARTRASQDFATLLDNLKSQRDTQEGSLRQGVLSNQQQINGQLSQIAAQRAQAQGLGYSGTLAAINPYQSAISSEQGSIDGLFNQFNHPNFNVTPVNPQQVSLKDYLVNSTKLGTQNAQSQDPNQTLSYYLNKNKDTQGVAA